MGCAAFLKAKFELAAAILALAAAASWFIAARHPVGVPGPTPYMPSDRNHPLWQQIRAHGQKILMGARWNQVAAAFAGASALAQSLSCFLS
jgi:hypothetical protein